MGLKISIPATLNEKVPLFLPFFPPPQWAFHGLRSSCDLSSEQIGVTRGSGGNARKTEEWSVGTALGVGQVCTIESITISVTSGATG